MESKLPKMTKATTLLKDLADPGNDKRGAAGYETRTLASKVDLGSLINL